jgi:porin
MGATTNDLEGKGAMRTTNSAAAIGLAVLSVSIGAPAGALAQEAENPAAPAPPNQSPSEAGAPAAPPEAPPRGLVPLADYTGEPWTRSYLAGDLWGMRSVLAGKGLSFEVDWTQSVQSVVNGGRNAATEYGGGLDYLMSLDFDRMGLIPGGLLKFRGESRYGLSVNGDAGPITPVNFDAMFPLTNSLDEGVPIAITNLNYTQFLSPHFAVMVGKFDTADGDANEFASGRGVGQFMNSNLVANGVFALGMPYSTLGAGLIWVPDPQLQIVATFANSSDSSTTSGFADIGDGWLASVEAQFQYRLGDLPGGITAGGTYDGNTDFVKIGGRLTFHRGEGLALPTDDSLWCLYANAWQYVYVKDSSDAPIVLSNGKADRQGLGLFVRAGISDDDTDPVGWALSGGIGGRGLLPGRDDDMFGVGYYYNHIVVGRFTGLAGLDDHSQGMEAFYNIAITPAAHLTLDFQYVQAALPRNDPGAVIGARFALTF